MIPRLCLCLAVHQDLVMVKLIALGLWMDDFLLEKVICGS
jgi:hypothetical protein